tara:strand:+ start:1534 stop:1902 length:369 start_codon:yes stop_codon:yes gene_type:complete
MYKMLEKNQRILYFLVGCIGIRSLLAITPLYLTYSWLQIFSIPIFVIGASFLFLYFTNGRLNAPEGGGDTWWVNYRLIHGLLYLAAAIYLFKQQRLAWIPLAIDTLLGLFLFLFNHKFIKFN